MGVEPVVNIAYECLTVFCMGFTATVILGTIYIAARF